MFLRRGVFLESHGRFGFYHSLRCTFPRASGKHHVAMPQESSQRFGLRTSKEGAIQRSHDFAEWERLYVRGGEGGEVPVLTHKDCIVCTLRVYAIGYLQKSIGEVLVRTKPTEYRWRGGIQHREVMSDGRVLYEITNYERILQKGKVIQSRFTAKKAVVSEKWVEHPTPRSR